MRPCRCRDYQTMLSRIYGCGYRLALAPYDAGSIYCACNVGMLMGSTLSPVQRGYAAGVWAGKKQVAIFGVPEHHAFAWWRELEHRDGHGLRYQRLEAHPDHLLLGFHALWAALLWGGLRFAGAGTPKHHGQHQRKHADHAEYG